MKGHFSIALVLLLAACGGKQSVASKSATEYREAQAKGIQVGGGHDHAQHGAAAATPAATDVDHSAHGATAHAGHQAPEASTAHAEHAPTSHAGHATTSHAGHATTAHAGPATTSHAGHRATTSHAQHAQHAQQPQHDPHAQHQPSSDPHAGHAMAPRTSAPVARAPITLKPDAFDAPAPSAVAEAAKASPRAEGDGTYVCPMHPEVTSAGPGTCPKCGMALVKRKSS